LTDELKFDIISLLRLYKNAGGFVLKNGFKNLLPSVILDGVAPKLKLRKIKLGFPKKVVWLTIVTFILLNFLGYYPNFGIPPFKKSEVLAQTQQQVGEIIPASFSKPLILPHPGYLSTKFSNWHPGIDIATGLGMPIHPITDGEITGASRNIFGLGNFVEVIHENGFKSTYAHMGKVYVRQGQKVTSESILGEVGLTGRTSGPHTHLEITHNGQSVDPLKLLPEIPGMPQPVNLVKKQSPLQPQ